MEKCNFAKDLSHNLMSEGYTFGAAARLEPLMEFDFESHVLVTPPRNSQYSSKLQKNQSIPYRAIPDFSGVISMRDFFIGNTKNVNF